MPYKLKAVVYFDDRNRTFVSARYSAIYSINNDFEFKIGIINGRHLCSFENNEEYEIQKFLFTMNNNIILLLSSKKLLGSG